MFKKIIFLTAFISIPIFLKGQNIPLNLSNLNDLLRREQVSNQDSSVFSFSYGPLNLEKYNSTNGSLSKLESILLSNVNEFGKKGRGELYVLPAFIDSKYNLNRPFGGNDGAMIPAKGFQFILSSGIYLKYGRLSIQLYPKLFYSQNLPFSEYPENAPSSYFELRKRDILGIDNPVRHGQESITEFISGNSNIMMNFGSFQAGVSSENIWWGPSKSNALLISNNAPGFLHATIKTVKPAKTFLGNFEGQYFAGKLDGSELSYYSDGKAQDLFGEKDNDTWRYFTGISLSYSPKWIKGLSIGGSRTFQVYRKDMEDGFRAWFPLFDPFPKEGVGNVENILLREDQHLGVFFRWYFPKIGFEFYGEYLRNDHALNWRDAVLNPEHSRGYILGLAKYVKLNSSRYTLGFETEMVQTKNSINRLTRYGGLDRSVNIYYNGQVSHGLTNKGQILGSSLNNSGNQQLLRISVFEGINRAYVGFTRLEQDPHFYYNASVSNDLYKKWIDLVFSAGIDYQYKSLYFSPTLNLISSNNVNWYSSNPLNENEFSNNENSFNLNFSLKVMYSF